MKITEIIPNGVFEVLPTACINPLSLKPLLACLLFERCKHRNEF
jgi:hypothetical protein